MSYYLIALLLSLIVEVSESAAQAYRRDPGHPQWHHGAFQDVKDSVRSEVRQMLHSRAEVHETDIFKCHSSPEISVCFGLHF